MKSFDSQLHPARATEWASWDYWRVCRWLIVWKVAFFLLAFMCIELWPQWELGSYESERHWPLDGESTLASRFAVWNAPHFLFLAKNGYQKDDPSCSLFPLYPILIRVVGYAFGDHLLAAALTLTQVISILALLTFHRLVWETLGTPTADWASVILVVFPGAIFLSFPYSEALSVALGSLFLLYLHRGQVVLSGVAGLFLALSSAYGFLCLFPMAWFAGKASKPVSVAVSMYGPILGFGFYLFLCHQFTGNPTEGFDLPGAHADRLAFERILNPKAIAKAALNIGSLHDRSDSTLDRIFFVILLGSLPFISRLNKSWFWFMLPFCLVPAASSLFQSYSRHIMLCIPFFILLGTAVQPPERLWIRWAMIGGLTGLQLYFLLRHLNFMWAG